MNEHVSIDQNRAERICASEAIQFAGRTQSCGCLLVADMNGLISHMSENCERWLGGAAETLLGKRVDDVLPEFAVARALKFGRETPPISGVERIFGVQLPDRALQAQAVDLRIFATGASLAIEIAPSGDDHAVDEWASVNFLSTRMLGARTTSEVCQIVANGVRAISHFDRVLVYRFEHDESGVVEAESCSDLVAPSLLGLRFPATDIPEQARALYRRSLVRMVTDVYDWGVPLVGREANQVDLSLSVLRSVSPVHLQYLRNLGVSASMSISLIVEGRLWGLIACHHFKPYLLDQRRMGIAETLGQLCASNLARIEAELVSHAVVDAMHAADLAALFGDESDTPQRSAILRRLAEQFSADGALLLTKRPIQSDSQEPEEALEPALRAALAPREGEHLVAVNVFPARETQGRMLGPPMGGFLAMRIGTALADWLVVVRSEQAWEEIWAGDPGRAITLDENGNPAPRADFSPCRRQIGGRCQPWSRADLARGHLLRSALLEASAKQSESSQYQESVKFAERQRLLIGELNHRVRNLLTLVRGLVIQSCSRAESVEACRSLVLGRIEALARVHTKIERTEWTQASLHEIVTDELAAVGEAHQFSVSGLDVQLSPDACQSMALIAHELATNARKYGGLSSGGGQVEVDWSLSARGDKLRMRWIERVGQQLVDQPARNGFGTRLISAAFRHELGGSVETSLTREGLQLMAEIPTRHIVGTGRVLSASPRRQVQMRGPEATGSVLVLEDDLVIALMTESMVRQLGYEDVRIAGSVREAESLLEMPTLGLAILDIHLGDHTSEPIATRLREMRVPTVVATGYSSLDELPIPMAPFAAHLTKPYGIDELARAIHVAALESEGRPASDDLDLRNARRARSE